MARWGTVGVRCCELDTEKCSVGSKLSVESENRNMRDWFLGFCRAQNRIEFRIAEPGDCSWASALDYFIGYR